VTRGLTVSRLREKLSAVDPLLVSCCLIALLVYLAQGFHGWLNKDLALYAYAGQQVAEGVPPYVAVANRAGPLAHLLPGVAVVVGRAVGADDLLAMRVFFMLIAIGCVGLAYLLGRDLFHSRLAGVSTAAALLAFHGFISLASNGPREKTAMVLFCLAALLATTRQRWLIAGFLVGLATLVWQPVFFALCAGAVVAVIVGVPPGGRWRAMARFGVGGLIPAALTAASYAAIGRLQVFLECFVLINGKYTSQVENSLLSNAGDSWSALTDGYGASLWLVLIGAVSIVGTSVLVAVRGRPQDFRDAAHIAAGVACLAGLAWTVRAFDGWPDAFLLLPFAALGIGSLVHAVAQRIPPRVALVGVVVLSAACTATALAHALGTRNDRLDRQREAVERVMRVVPHARFYSVEAPHVLVFTHQRQVSRFQTFGNGMGDYIDDTYPGGLRGYGRWIGRSGPTVIAVGMDVPSWLDPVLRHSYKNLGRAPGWEWYVRRDVGPDTLRELDEAVVPHQPGQRRASSPSEPG
jgi:hypothetical protein